MIGIVVIHMEISCMEVLMMWLKYAHLITRDANHIGIYNLLAMDDYAGIQLFILVRAP